jgi:hypothetical protein
MPKLIDYPRSSLKNALELAKAVDSLGGSGKIGSVATTMGLKESGAFSAQIGGAVKYGLILSQKGNLLLSPLYKEYKLAYTDNDSIVTLRKAFLHVPLFEKVYRRFMGQKLPTDILDKLLIKEFGVEDSAASRVSGYLVDAARTCRILGDDHVFLVEEALGDSSALTQSPPDESAVEEVIPAAAIPDSCDYTIHFRGPGMDSKITVRDEDDLLIVQATLNKVKKKLGEASEASA